MSEFDKVLAAQAQRCTLNRVRLQLQTVLDQVQLPSTELKDLATLDDGGLFLPWFPLVVADGHLADARRRLEWAIEYLAEAESLTPSQPYGWVVHNGLGCPLRVGTLVRIRFRDGEQRTARVSRGSYDPQASLWFGSHIRAFCVVAPDSPEAELFHVEHIE